MYIWQNITLTNLFLPNNISDENDYISFDNAYLIFILILINSLLTFYTSSKALNGREVPVTTKNMDNTYFKYW